MRSPAWLTTCGPRLHTLAAAAASTLVWCVCCAMAASAAAALRGSSLLLRLPQPQLLPQATTPATAAALLAARGGCSTVAASRRRLTLLRDTRLPPGGDGDNGPHTTPPQSPPRKSDALRLARNACGGVAPAVILVRTTLPDNIGACARAMLNFGLHDLRLVEPRCDALAPAAVARAAGAEDVLRGAVTHASVAEAVADLGAVYATTARTRDMTTNIVTPRRAAADMAALASTAPSTASPASAVATRGGMLFGPEASGLSNVDLAHATALIQIPTFPPFSSLNLAQAVNLLAYEWWQAFAGGGDGGASAADAVTAAAADAAAGVTVVRGRGALAPRGDVDALFSRLETALDSAEFAPIPEHRDSVYRQLRGALNRASLTEAEVGILQGVLTALTRGPKSARKGTKRSGGGGSGGGA